MEISGKAMRRMCADAQIARRARGIIAREEPSEVNA